MSRFEKLKNRILDHAQRGNITFEELCNFVERLGFNCHPKATGHKVFTKEGIDEIINLQSGQNGKAKRYQVAQVAAIVLQYEL